MGKDNPQSSGTENPDQKTETKTDEVKAYPHVKEDGSFTETFLTEGVEEDLRDNKVLSKFKTVGDLAKSYVNLEKKLGADKVVIPKADDEQGWEDLANQLGRPEDSEKYEIPTPPEGVPFDEGLAKFFKGAAHKAGLNQRSATILVNEWNQYVANMLGADAKEEEVLKAEASEELKTKWGSHYGDELELANDAIRTFDPDGVLDALGLSNNPLVVRIFNGVGHAISEDKLIHRPPARPESKESARAKIAEIMANPGYTNPRDPNHKQLVAEATRYFKVANAE